MLMPKRTKYRKPHRVSYEGVAKGNLKVDFADFGLLSLDGAYLTANQIESARIVLSRYVRKGGKVVIRVFPHLSRTKKPLEVRMGSGKGAPDHWVAIVKTGQVMFEIGGIAESEAREALRIAAQKLPVRCKIITRESEGQ